jgi:hypothetical protein
LLASLGVMVGGPSAEAQERAPVVVELFTSQGCSSCPPADALLRELSMFPDIIALSLHVDYWDYIGWKDPFASEATTERQRAYARARDERMLYTPQMIVDGRFDLVGSRREEILRAIEECFTTRKPVRLSVEGAALHLSAGPAPETPADVWLFAYDKDHVTRVAVGENAGQRLDNHHVVRDLAYLGDWAGAAKSLPLDLAAYRRAGRAGVALLVQQAGQGEILGALKFDFAP